MIIRSAIVIFICVLSLTAFSQSIYNDTVISIEQVEINKKLKNPKIKKFVYGKKRNSYHSRHIAPHYYLIDNFPYGKLFDISLNAFNAKKYKGKLNGTKIKNIVFCDKTEHPLNIYEVKEEDGVLSLGQLLFSDSYMLPPDNSKVEYKIQINLSDIEIYTNRFFIELANTIHYTVSPSNNCYTATQGFNTVPNPEGIYYVYDNEGNFIEKTGFSIQMDLRVLTREY